MIFEYSLNKEDFVQYQLFIASYSELIKKRRKRNLVMVPVAYVLFAVISILFGSITGAGLFLLLAVAWVFAYPVWERNRYRKHYEKHMQEHYRNRFNTPLSIVTEEDKMICSEGDLQSTVPYTEVREVNEIPTNIFITLKGGESVIIPKKFDKLPELRNRLKELSARLEFPYKEYPDWKWK